MSFTPEEIVNEIKQYIKDFEVVYNPDSVRQKIGRLSWVDQELL